MRHFVVLFAVYLSMVPWLDGQDPSGLDRRVREGQDALYRLDYAQAESVFRQLIEEHPNSPVGYGMLSIATWNQLLFAASNLALDDYASPTPFTKGRTYRKGDPLKPVAIFQDLREKYPQNFLFDINLAAIHQFNLDDAESALGIYQQLLKNLSTKAPGLLAGEVNLGIGLAYLQLGQHSLALQAFTQVLHEAKGEMETDPLAYFHMAQIHEQRGEKDQAVEYYQQVVKDSVPGADWTD